MHWKDHTKLSFIVYNKKIVGVLLRKICSDKVGAKNLSKNPWNYLFVIFFFSNSHPESIVRRNHFTTLWYLHFPARTSSAFQKKSDIEWMFFPSWSYWPIYGLENIRFPSHVLGSIPIITVENWAKLSANHDE